jgi:hypothetical protein
MRKNPKIFDEQSTTPRELCSAECFISSYEESHFHLESQKDKIRDYLGEARLYRNGQAITGFRLEGYNSSTARAGAQGMLKSFHHRTEIQYTTLSTQNNPTDNVFGIQSNKNQNQNVLPENLERLICKLKKRNFDKIETHFNEVINHAKEAKRLAAEAKKQAAAALRQQTRVVLEVEEEVEEDEVKDEVNDKKDESQVLDIVQEDPKVEQDDDFDHFEDASDDDAKQEEPKQEEQKQEPNLEPKQQLEEQNQEEKEEEEEPEQVPLITKQLLLRLLDEKINENTDESKIMVIYNLLNNM